MPIRKINISQKTLKDYLRKSLTPKDIAKFEGVTRSRIYQLIKFYNLSHLVTDQGNQRKAVVKVEWTPEKLEELRLKIETTNTTFRDIAKHFGVSAERIRQMRLKYGQLWNEEHRK
jgi:transposase